MTRDYDIRQQTSDTKRAGIRGITTLFRLRRADKHSSIVDLEKLYRLAMTRHKQVRTATQEIENAGVRRELDIVPGMALELDTTLKGGWVFDSRKRLISY